jgi:uncharacterized protein (DUF362 family)
VCFGSCAPSRYSRPTDIHAAVDAALRSLGLPDDFIRPGERVVLKPNWVKEHDERRPGPDAWEHVVTHPAVVETATRWAAASLRDSGSVVICDAPQTDFSFDRIREYCRLDAVVEPCRADFPGARIELLDLRPEVWKELSHGPNVSRNR